MAPSSRLKIAISAAALTGWAMLERPAKGDAQSSAPPPPTAVSGSIPEDDDPPAGDEIEQNDDRVVGGFDLRVRKHVHYLGAKFTTTGSIQTRVDAIDNALHHDDARVRLEDRADSRIGESALAVFVEDL